MNKFLLTLFSTGFVIGATAQPTWSEDAAAVFYNNCTECHNPEGIGTFSLMDYSTAYDYRSLVQTYVEYNIMPPWTADSSFQHYFDERILTEYERNTIIDWANGGGLEGDPALAPPPPVYSGEQQLHGVPDLVLTMPNYMSKATAIQDDYVCISLPTGLTENKKIKAIEIIPGNRTIVHHCLVYNDADGSYDTDTIGGNCGGPSAEPLIAGYTPGARPTIFPSSEDFSSGMILEAGSNIVFALHYPEGSYGEFDQTRVHIYFYEEPIVGFREIIAGAIIQNWMFDLPANEITAVSAVVEDIGLDLTVLSAFPHMHLLGQSIEAYALDPDGDTIPFVRIPQWDFHWQDFYWFEYMQHMPMGSTLYGNGVYDNTVGNPHNPSDPPVNVSPGFNTSDEMFLIYFHIMAYQEGDELINVDSLNSIYLAGITETPNETSSGITVFPNPFDETISINYGLLDNSYVRLYIYDMAGKLVKKVYSGQQESGDQTIVWDGNSDEGGTVAKGIYHYSMLINGQPYTGRIVKQ